MINGTTHEVTENASLADALTEYGVGERGVAVAVDGSVVPRADWSNTRLSPGSSIEVLTAVQGG